MKVSKLIVGKCGASSPNFPSKKNRIGDLMHGHLDESSVFLRRYIPMADMIVATFGSKCEVVVHNLKDLQASLIYMVSLSERPLPL